MFYSFFFFFSSRRRHTRSLCDWSSDVCSSDLLLAILVHQVRHVLECEADGIDALDDPVVEILADPLALLDDRESLDLFVQPGVFDCDPGMGANVSTSRDPVR